MSTDHHAERLECRWDSLFVVQQFFSHPYSRKMPATAVTEQHSAKYRRTCLKFVKTLSLQVRPQSMKRYLQLQFITRLHESHESLSLFSGILHRVLRREELTYFSAVRKMQSDSYSLRAEAKPAKTTKLLIWLLP